MIHNASGSKLLILLLPLLFLTHPILGNKNGNGIVHKGLYSNEIIEAEVIVPRKVSLTGEHISYDILTSNENSTLHLNVTISDEDHLLILKPTKSFISPSLIIERHKRDSHVRLKPKSINCHYEGSVYGKSNSRVAISNCNGLVGFIHTENGKYWIEPSHHHVKKVSPGHKHLIYKRSAVVSSNTNKKKKKKRKKHSNNCGTREPKRITELEWQKQKDRVKIQERHSKHKQRITFQNITRGNLKKHRYSNIDNSRLKRSVSKARYVEALLVADSTMVEFHEQGDVETYLLSIMNMVSSLYSDPSIGNLIKVTVVKIILIDDPQSEPNLNVTINADITLKSFCKWQRKLNPSSDSDPHHHDVAILVTRKDICARQDYPCNTLGVAHVAGMCKAEKSCSVNEDNGITLAHTITHEMGHNFGMYHDTDKIGCKGRVGNRLHIMTPMFEADTIEVIWSRCSRRDVTNFLDKGMGDCLKDEPGETDEYEYPDLPVGAMYNTEIQCQLQFGPDAKVCTSITEICSRLWCEINGTCTTQLRPAAPGTQCGKHMWCQEHKCVPIMDPPVAIDGGWGEWSSWSHCSRTCGTGVSIIERKCDHPKPAAGGKFCVGERRRYRICNTERCPENQPSFRAVQCSSYNNQTYDGKKYTWLPYFDKDEPCELYCSDINDTIIIPWGEHAMDGTPCNLGTRDVCISGICKKVGCDWVVDSKAIEDACGICQGDGSTCHTIRGEYTKQTLGGGGYREMIIIPNGSRNIRIEEKGYSENYISIGSATSSKFYLNGKRHITLPGEYTVAGAQALYERKNEFEKIHIPGPITESILVYVLFRGKTYNPGVSYQFTISKKETPKQVKYMWVLGDWSQCSVTCGGGVQHRRPLCQETLMSEIPSVIDGTSSFVDETHCDPSERIDSLSRTCKDDPCPSNWWIGPWQSCPVTCKLKGEKQMRRRSVMCVDGSEMALPDRYCDTSSRPKEYEPCKSLPICTEDR